MSARLQSLAVGSLLLIRTCFGECNSYYQANDASSTKRPFDICYHSSIEEDGSKSSYRYYCHESTTEEYEENSVNGFTAYKEVFPDIDCQGEANETRIVNEPYQIFCVPETESKCDIMRTRQYPILNATACTYDETTYEEDIEVVAVCNFEGNHTEAYFCKKQEDNDGHGSYYWYNKYYDQECTSDRKFEATYTFHGCMGDGETFIQLLECDYDGSAVTMQVKPFDDGLFVAGFVLLLIAILCIVGILLWYCCWFKKGFRGSVDRRGPHVAARSTGYDDEDDDDDYNDGAGTTSMR